MDKRECGAVKKIWCLPADFEHSVPVFSETEYLRHRNTCSPLKKEVQLLFLGQLINYSLI